MPWREGQQRGFLEEMEQELRGNEIKINVAKNKFYTLYNLMRKYDGTICLSRKMSLTLKLFIYIYFCRTGLYVY